MRDQEFVAAMKRMSPILYSKFFALAKKAKVMDDRKSFAEDLVSWTILEALINSRKEIHSEKSCEQLIRIKANNIWNEFWKQRLSSFNHSNHEDLNFKCDQVLPIQDDTSAKDRFDWVLKHATPKQADILNKRIEGYEVNEIAKMRGKSPGSITMQIQRLKEKVLKHP